MRLLRTVYIKEYNFKLKKYTEYTKGTRVKFHSCTLMNKNKRYQSEKLAQLAIILFTTKEGFTKALPKYLLKY